MVTGQIGMCQATRHSDRGSSVGLHCRLGRDALLHLLELRENLLGGQIGLLTLVFSAVAAVHAVEVRTDQGAWTIGHAYLGCGDFARLERGGVRERDLELLLLEDPELLLELDDRDALLPRSSRFCGVSRDENTVVTSA